MNPLALLWLWRIGGVLLLSGSLTAAYFGWAKHEQSLGAVPYIAAISKQKAEAAQVLATESAKVAAATKALQDFKTQRENEDATNEKTISLLADRVVAVAGPTGRLYDRTGCGSGGGSAKGADPVSAVDSAGNPSQTGGLLSKSTSELFQRIAREADEVNAAYASCRADAFAVRAAQPQ